MAYQTDAFATQLLPKNNFYHTNHCNLRAPETPRTITALGHIEGFKGALNWAPMMPRD